MGLRFGVSLATLCAFCALGCGDDASTTAQAQGGGGASIALTRFVDDVSGEPPPRLSEVGIYADVSAQTPAADALSYEPAHALYSNGLDKGRWLFLPPGTKISTLSAGWEFPIGTLLAKTFLHQGRALETRLLFRREAGWDYALYAYRDDGSEADLFPGNWAEQVISLENGALEHVLPARLDCRSCHETSEERMGSPVLGIGPWQLSPALINMGVFDSPPEIKPAEGRTPEETSALGYFVGNCVSCHTGGRSTNASFDLYPDKAIEETVGVPTQAETGEGLRVAPGDPASSVLFLGVVEAPLPGYQGPFKAMPPIGLTRVDPAAEALLRDWIEQL